MLNDKKAFLEWLQNEGAIYEKEGVLHAEKAFFANSAINWCAKQATEGTMDVNQIENCVRTIRKYLKGKLDLCWKNGIITTADKKKES